MGGLLTTLFGSPATATVTGSPIPTAAPFSAIVTDAPTVSPAWTDMPKWFVPAGNDLATTTDVANCKAQCAGNPACQGITTNGTICWLKSLVDPGTFGSGAGWSTSYLQSRLPPNVAPMSWTDVAGRYIPAGNDLATTTNVPYCKTMCSNNPACRGITTDGTTCWLKSKVDPGGLGSGAGWSASYVAARLP